MGLDRINHQKLRKLFLNILKSNDVSPSVGNFLVEGILQASLRGVDSHGIRLFPHYLEGFKKGRLNKKPNYTFDQTGAATGCLDADHAAGHAATLGYEMPQERSIDIDDKFDFDFAEFLIQNSL